MAENWVSEERPVSGFDRVAMQDTGDLVIIQGSAEALRVEANADMLDRIVSEVRDGTLRLGLKDWLDRLTVWPKDFKIRYTLTVKDLNRLCVSGAATVAAGSLHGRDLEIKSGGAVKINIDKLSAETLTVDISGSGDVHLAGRAPRQEVRVSGAGEYSAAELESQSARLNLSGSSKVQVRVSDDLHVSISGMAVVDYTGSPKVTQSISGMGKVRQVRT